MNSILFITSFRNIGRDNWTAFRRDVREYVRRFDTMVDNMRYPIVAYVEANTRLLLRPRSHLTVTNLEDVQSFYDRYEAVEQAIIDSDAYKAMIPPKRKNHPEHLYSSYNLSTHSKVNCIRDAMDRFPEYTHYAWIDFGCVTSDLSIIPYNIDMDKLDGKRIMNTFFKMPAHPGRSPQEMLSTFDIYVPTGMFIVPRNLVSIYEQLYDKELQYWHSIGVSDDDQSLVYQLMLKYPDIFVSLPTDGIWSVLFKKHLNLPAAAPVIHESVSNELFEMMSKHGSAREETVCKIYEGLLVDKRQSVRNVFELGVGSRNASLKCSGGEPGGCLRAWREFFPGASVYGADIDRESLIREDRISTQYCNKLAGTHRLGEIDTVEFDLIVDSAGGSLESSMRFMDAIIGKLSGSGLYAVEGLSASEVAACRVKTDELERKYPFRFVVHNNLLLALPKF